MMEKMYLPIDDENDENKLDHGDKQALLHGEPEDAKEKRNLLLCILLSLFAIQSVNMNVTTIIPDYIEQKYGNKLDSKHGGLIIV